MAMGGDDGNGSTGRSRSVLIRTHMHTLTHSHTHTLTKVSHEVLCLKPPLSHLQQIDLAIVRGVDAPQNVRENHVIDVCVEGEGRARGEEWGGGFRAPGVWLGWMSGRLACGWVPGTCKVARARVDFARVELVGSSMFVVVVVIVAAAAAAAVATGAAMSRTEVQVFE